MKKRLQQRSPADERFVGEPRWFVLAKLTQTDDLLVLEITDRYGDGGPEYGYRLTVSPAQPDFWLGFLPAPASTEQEGSVPETGD